MGFMGLRNSPFQGAIWALSGIDTGRFIPSFGLFQNAVWALSPGRPRIIRPDGLFFGTPAARIMPVLRSTFYF